MKRLFRTYAILASLPMLMMAGKAVAAPEFKIEIKNHLFFPPVLTVPALSLIHISEPTRL